jgi:hypothetical protein
MLLVAGIDALRRIADLEIRSRLQPRCLFENGNAVVFNRAGIDRRFINDDVAFLSTDPTVREAANMAPRSG